MTTKLAGIRSTITILAAALLLLGPSHIFASGQLADPDDIFLLNSPAPSAVVSGQVNVSWRVFDDEQSMIPYEVNLRDRTTCAAHVGTIAAGKINSDQNKDAQLSFNSRGPLIDISTVPDGSYCLQICHSFLNNGNPYSSCNLRGITIRNHNAAPQITSSPPADRTIRSSDNWSYDVNAIDSDGDPLSYALVTAPNFLTINQASGLVQTNGNFKAQGEYTVRVRVQDSFGGSAVQTFTLIVQDSINEVPKRNEPAEIKISFPKADSKFNGRSNQIIWEASDAESIVSTRIFYSADGRTWLQIAEVSANHNLFEWDVSGLENGSYFVQISVEDSEGVVTAQVSEAFSVNNPDVQSEQSYSSKPLIINVSPQDRVELRGPVTTISGEFTPPVDDSIDPAGFRFLIDGIDRIEYCEVSARRFSCTNFPVLESGAHKVRAEIRSQRGQTAVKEWIFTVLGEDGGMVVLPEVVSPGLSMVLTMLCLIVLLVTIPFVIYLLWRNRERFRGINLDLSGFRGVGVQGRPAATYADRGWTQPQPAAADATLPAGDITPPAPGVELELPDPAAFDNYDDYLAAISDLPQINVNYVPAAELTAPGGELTTPSYVDIDIEPDAVDTAEAAFTPGWLQAVPAAEAELNYGGEAAEPASLPAPTAQTYEPEAMSNLVPEPTFSSTAIEDQEQQAGSDSGTSDSADSGADFGYGK